VTVIANTKAGLLSKLPDPLPPLLDPSHGDLTQLWQALMTLFAQKYITTPITKTVHGVGADFVDLIAAMKWVGGYIITQTGSVTFMVAPGKWTYTQTVEINHQNSSRIFIQGGALLGGAPTRANLSVTGFHSATDASNQIIYLRSVFATELSFTGGITGFRTFSAGLTLRYLLITGSQDIFGGGSPGALNRNGNGVHLYQTLWIDCIAIWGFGNIGISINECSLRCETSLSLTVSYCGFEGVDMRSGEFRLDFSEVILVSHNVCALVCFGGYAVCGKLTARGTNSTAGNGAVEVEVGGQLSCGNSADISQNLRSGLICSGASTLICEYSSVYTNATGCWTTGGGISFLDYSSVGSLSISGAAYVEIIGGSYTTSDLAPNAVGNANSYLAA
jgi:hypothetical protein